MLIAPPSAHFFVFFNIYTFKNLICYWRLVVTRLEELFVYSCSSQKKHLMYSYIFLQMFYMFLYMSVAIWVPAIFDHSRCKRCADPFYEDCQVVLLLCADPMVRQCDHPRCKRCTDPIYKDCQVAYCCEDCRRCPNDSAPRDHCECCSPREVKDKYNLYYAGEEDSSASRDASTSWSESSSPELKPPLLRLRRPHAHGLASPSGLAASPSNGLRPPPPKSLVANTGGLKPSIC